MQKFVLSSCDMFCCHWMLMCEAQGRRQEEAGLSQKCHMREDMTAM